MVIKAICHYMPWDLDLAILNVNTIKKSSYMLQDGDKLIVALTLNLSSYIVDWYKSEISIDLLKDKFQRLSHIIGNTSKISYQLKVFLGDALYGHLDSQRESIKEDNVDGYIQYCPDIYFSETLIPLYFQAAKMIKEKYFVVAAQTPKLWDNTWDVLLNSRYKDMNFKNMQYQNINIYDINNDISQNQNWGRLILLPTIKFAGWMDYYSKGFAEQLFPVPDDWHGYGSWDLYCIILGNDLIRKGFPLKQYVIENQIISQRYLFDGENVHNNTLTMPYRELICRKNIPDQREVFESTLQQKLNEWKAYAIKEGL